MMGGIADYSGSLVLQWPIREATRVAVCPWPTRRIVDHIDRARRRRRRCDVPLDVVGDPHGPYDSVRAWFAADPDTPLGGLCRGRLPCARARARRDILRRRALFIESDIPEGKGVSSSAAIEAATMEAVVGAWSADD